MLPETYEKAPAGYPEPVRRARSSAKVNFDSDLSERATTWSSSLFDHTITFRHKELVAATKAIHEAAAKLAAQAECAGRSKLLAEARELRVHAAWSTSRR